MSTRRTPHAASDPLAVNSRETNAPSSLAPSNITPAVPLSIILKLLFFTFLMVTAPISTYFFVARISHNNTYGGAAAAIIANAVLLGYVLVAVYEDQGEDHANVKEHKRGKAE